MPEGPQGQKPPKAKKITADPKSRGLSKMRQATNQEVGDIADKITRAPKKKTR